MKAIAADSPADPDRPHRSVRKRRAILDAATEVFLKNGYLGTNMDDVAALSVVSKQTVYKHFADKEALFTEIVISMVNKASDMVDADLLELRDDGDLAENLRNLAYQQLTLVVQPRMMQLRRLVIGEVGRFPELAMTFYERGPERTISALAAAFERLADQGLLALKDPLVAASQFNWLIMSAPVNRAMLLGDGAIPKPTELRRHVEDGVRVFLAAYGSGPIQKLDDA